jgi:release factor glutamine methyltransferase
MTLREATKYLVDHLSRIYDDRESSAITDWVLEFLTGWKKAERIINKGTVLSTTTTERLDQITKQLVAHKPVQYVLNEAWFHGMKLYVDENVLIPRPETEELVEWTLKEVDSGQMTGDRRELRVLDVGTGSGCIPIAIKQERPEWEVYACDISLGALGVAKKNAADQNVEIEFLKLNFLNETERSLLPRFDLIVSNPPYISVEEKATIDKHVVEYEPHLALFVPEDDSLIFYDQLADFGKSHLLPDGFMVMEMHYAKAGSLKNLFGMEGYESEVRKDMHGNERMIKVWLRS